jgi:hypothetical protein
MTMAMMSGEGQFAMWIAVGLGFLGIFLGPIGHAIGQRLGGTRKVDAPAGLTTGEMTAERVAAMEERIMELEAERGQLEERLDFAERMLTKGQSDQRVTDPSPEA